MTSTNNHIQPGFSAFVIFLYALYGANIISLFILVGDKGNNRSADFILFAIVILLLGLSNLFNILISRTFKVSDKSLLMLFFMYMFLRLIPLDTEIQSYYIRIIFTDIGKYFIAGVISFSVLRSRLTIVSTIMTRFQSVKGIKSLAILGTLIFIVFFVYFLSLFSGVSVLDISEFKYLPNDYYQDFGDYTIIAFCCLVSLQIAYFKRHIFTNIIFAVLSLILLSEALLAFFCLQAVNSNKSVLTIALITIFSIYFCKQKKFLKGPVKTNYNRFIVILLPLIVSMFFYLLLPAIDVSQLRIFDYGESSSIFTNSSLRVRLDQAMDSGMEQLLIAPLFGDLSIRGYIHSTIISLQTHLGFIGSMLLWSFTLIQLNRIYRHDGNEVLKSIAVPILFVTSVSSFFSWGPLWFLIGAMYAYMPQTQIKYIPVGDFNSLVY